MTIITPGLSAVTLRRRNNARSAAEDNSRVGLPPRPRPRTSRESDLFSIQSPRTPPTAAPSSNPYAIHLEHIQDQETPFERKARLGAEKLVKWFTGGAVSPKTKANTFLGYFGFWYLYPISGIGYDRGGKNPTWDSHVMVGANILNNVISGLEYASTFQQGAANHKTFKSFRMELESHFAEGDLQRFDFLRKDPKSGCIKFDRERIHALLNELDIKDAANTITEEEKHKRQFLKLVEPCLYLQHKQGLDKMIASGKQVPVALLRIAGLASMYANPVHGGANLGSAAMLSAAMGMSGEHLLKIQDGMIADGRDQDLLRVKLIEGELLIKSAKIKNSQKFRDTLQGMLDGKPFSAEGWSTDKLLNVIINKSLSESMADSRRGELSFGEAFASFEKHEIINTKEAAMALKKSRKKWWNVNYNAKKASMYETQISDRVAQTIYDQHIKPVIENDRAPLISCETSKWKKAKKAIKEKLKETKRLSPDEHVRDVHVVIDGQEYSAADLLDARKKVQIARHACHYANLTKVGKDFTELKTGRELDLLYGDVLTQNAKSLNVLELSTPYEDLEKRFVKKLSGSLRKTL